MKSKDSQGRTVAKRYTFKKTFTIKVSFRTTDDEKAGSIVKFLEGQIDPDKVFEEFIENNTKRGLECYNEKTKLYSYTKPEFKVEETKWEKTTPEKSRTAKPKEQRVLPMGLREPYLRRMLIHSQAIGCKGNWCTEYVIFDSDGGRSDESGEMLSKILVRRREYNDNLCIEHPDNYVNLFVNEAGDAYRSWKGKLAGRPVCNFELGCVYDYSGRKDIKTLSVEEFDELRKKC